MHDVAASFAESVADVLTAKTIAACERHGISTLVVGGGFSAIAQLRAVAAERCAAPGSALRLPPRRAGGWGGCPPGAGGATVPA